LQQHAVVMGSRSTSKQLLLAVCGFKRICFTYFRTWQSWQQQKQQLRLQQMMQKQLQQQHLAAANASAGLQQQQQQQHLVDLVMVNCRYP
jgi:hypothetical protein